MTTIELERREIRDTNNTLIAHSVLSVDSDTVNELMKKDLSSATGKATELDKIPSSNANIPTSRADKIAKLKSFGYSDAHAATIADAMGW